MLSTHFSYIHGKSLLFQFSENFMERAIWFLVNFRYLRVFFHSEWCINLGSINLGNTFINTISVLSYFKFEHVPNSLGSSGICKIWASEKALRSYFVFRNLTVFHHSGFIFFVLIVTVFRYTKLTVLGFIVGVEHVCFCSPFKKLHMQNKKWKL